MLQKENGKGTGITMDPSIIKLLTLKYYLMYFLPTDKEIETRKKFQYRKKTLLKMLQI